MNFTQVYMIPQFYKENYFWKMFTFNHMSLESDSKIWGEFFFNTQPNKPKKKNKLQRNSPRAGE